MRVSALATYSERERMSTSQGFFFGGSIASPPMLLWHAMTNCGFPPNGLNTFGSREHSRRSPVTVSSRHALYTPSGLGMVEMAYRWCVAKIAAPIISADPNNAMGGTHG